MRDWTPVCGGGLQWAHRRPYKNAITNETFMADAALLHEATPGDTRYARWALREWRWFSDSGMLTRSHLVVDGLSARCRPKLHSPTWTYNQGMLIGAMVSMAKMTGRPSFLVTAGKVAHAVSRNAVAVWARDRRGSSFGLDWAGPFRASTITAQASALDLLTTQIPALARPVSP